MDDTSFERARWWHRDGLEYVDRRLHFADRDVDALARELGTPLFLYDAARVSEKLRRLRSALDGRGLRGRVLYAMKANRFTPLLCHLRSLGAGIDACSPAEVALARRVGFRGREISFTATSLSTRDLEALARSPEVYVNCDSLSTVRRLGALAPGRGVGLRIDPGLGLGYRDHAKLRYSGGRHAKLGVALDRAEDALRLARRSGLRVTGLHVHAGCGYLTPQLSAFDRVLARIAELGERVHDLERINVGGGLGTPLTADDAPLDLEAWAEVVARRLGHFRTPAGGPIEILVEPGDFLVKDAGVLVCGVASVEEKSGVRFVGVDAGFNVQILPATYGLPLEPVPVAQPDPDSPLGPVTVAGNINEALDLFGVDIPMPEIAEGDHLALLGAGGYGSSMSSRHCLRGDFTEALL